MLTHLDLVEERKDSLTMDELVHWAEWICGRVTYLLEPLQVVEIDKRNGIAMIRSKMPKRKLPKPAGEKISYYEMLADQHHHASLRRYQYRRPTRERGSVPFGLTHEQLEVLVDDLVESAQLPTGS
jgi:hypothetical protein